MTDRQAVARERAASAAQYLLLGGFASAAAGISAQGLTGFARSNMALRGPCPYLLFFALDGAAGVCAVPLARRAARNDGGLAPRLAVWGLVAASAFFNFTHAPRCPAAAREGSPLGQVALAGKLRSQGHGVSNDRLRWLSAVSGLETPRGRPSRQRASARARRAGPAPVPGAVRSAPASSPGVVRDDGPDQARTDEPGAGEQGMQPPGGR
jgi:hypothetical protein